MEANLIRRSLLSASLLVAATGATACGDLVTDVRHVPQDYATIQEAITASDPRVEGSSDRH